MSYSAKIILDSIAPCGSRLTTFEISIPKFIQAELNTHRLLSRSSASTRAIPTAKLVSRVIDDPVMPVWWGENQAGMQAAKELGDVAKGLAIREWIEARDDMLQRVRQLMAYGLHKQIAGRLLEPWMFTSVIVSATEWTNFFGLRCHPDAQPEFRHVAEMMRDAYERSMPEEVDEGGWHMPYLTEDERDLIDCRGGLALADAIKVSTARCARVSYLNHDGERDVGSDLGLHDKLTTSGHWGPFEHVAMALGASLQSGNFYGWSQYRKQFADEHIGGRRA